MRLDQAIEMMARAKRVRDKKVRSMMAKGWGPSQIAEQLGVTRQRAQQIIKRLAEII